MATDSTVAGAGSDAEARAAERAAWIARLERHVYWADPQDVADLDRTGWSAIDLRNLYEERDYGTRVSFREPSGDETAMLGLRKNFLEHYQSPAWGMLEVDGRPTGWTYVRSDIDRGCFYVDAAGIRMAFERESDARELLVMLYDVATRGFDRDLPEAPGGERSWLAGPALRYLAREDIAGVPTAVGHRDGSPGDLIYRRETLPAGSEIFVDRTGTYTVQRGRGPARTLRRDIDLDPAADARTLQVPLAPWWIERSREFDRTIVDMPLPRDTPRIFERERVGAEHEL